MAEQETREIEKSTGGARQSSDFAAPTSGMSDRGMSGSAAESTTGIRSTLTEQAGNMARNLGEQARSAMADPGATAQELARHAREQTSMATDAMYRQGARAGEYLSRNVNEYPVVALLIAGAVGYGLAYLIHTQWQNWGGQDTSTQRERYEW